jgi:hypothetical protein
MSDAVQTINRVRSQVREQIQGLAGFDYGAPAELFPSRGNKGRSRVTYKRFDTAAEAIRFAVEDVPPAALLGAYLEVDEARFGLQEIHSLYENAAYPLKRRAVDATSK